MSESKQPADLECTKDVDMEEETIDTSVQPKSKWNDYFQFKIEDSKDISNVHPVNRETPVWEAWCETAKVPNSDDLLYSYIYCKYCTAWVHLKWYGHSTPLYKWQVKDEEKYDFMFVCDKWQYWKDTKIKPNSIKCLLWLKGNGLMKRVYVEHSTTKTAEFWHMICGMYCDDIEIKDLSKMMFYRKLHDLKVYEYDNKCWFCNTSDGFMLECDRQTCKNNCHPSCMNEDRKEAVANADDDVISWQINHTNAVSDNSKTIHDRQGLGIIGFEGSEIIEEYRKNKWRRGGYITIFCDIHRDLEEYCTCRMKEDDEQEIFMIGCDY